MTVITKASLAAELEITKARVSQYVAGGLPVRSDGKLNREEALKWISENHFALSGQDKGVDRAHRLTNARRVHSRPVARRAQPAGGEPDILLETLVGRARDWRDLRPSPGGLQIPIDVAAAMFAGGDRDAILIWLRAGLPFAVEGDWETGDGFVLVSHWTIEWGRWTTARVETSGDYASSRELRLDLFGASGRWTPELDAQFEAALPSAE